MPIEVSNNRIPGVNVTFPTVYTNQNAMLKCRAKSLKGFYSHAEVPFILVKRSTANAKAELGKLDLKKIVTDAQTVNMQN